MAAHIAGAVSRDLVTPPRRCCCAADLRCLSGSQAPPDHTNETAFGGPGRRRPAGQRTAWHEVDGPGWSLELVVAGSSPAPRAQDLPVTRGCVGCAVGRRPVTVGELDVVLDSWRLGGVGVRPRARVEQGDVASRTKTERSEHDACKPRLMVLTPVLLGTGNGSADDTVDRWLPLAIGCRQPSRCAVTRPGALQVDIADWSRLAG